MFNDFAIFWKSIDEVNSNFFDFNDMDQKIPPDPTLPDRMKIFEVGAEWKFFHPYIGVKIK